MVVKNTTFYQNLINFSVLKFKKKIVKILELEILEKNLQKILTVAHEQTVLVFQV